MEDNNKTKSQQGGGMATGNESRPDEPVNEKTSIGGDFNSGVTSNDPKEKDKIEKKATMGKEQPPSESNKTLYNEQEPEGDVLTKENLPDATNESKGKMGSGQRQDSN